MHTAELQSIEVSQSPEEKFREYLSSGRRPQRYTDQQRDLVLHVFAQHNHFDADLLIDELKPPDCGSAGPPFTGRSTSSWTPACCGAST